MPADYGREEWLRVHYHEKGQTQAEMADACGVSPRTIREWMDRHDVDTREIEGENHPLYGGERDEDVKRQIVETLRGRDVSAETKQRMSEAHHGSELPDSVREKIAVALSDRPKPPTTREKMSASRRGADNPNWKGGNSEHYGPGWNPAKRVARARDECCRNCGADEDEAYLEVHHVIPVREFANAPDADLRDAHDLSNLVLLCRGCRCEVHYGDLEFDTEIRHPAER